MTFFFYRIVAIRNHKAPHDQVKESSPNRYLVVNFNQHEKETLTLTNDGLVLEAWYIPADIPTDKTVIVVHGFRDGKINMKQYGELFRELGYNVLMPDNRAAGESQGKYITYGHYDKNDIIAWTQQLIKDNPNCEITYFGLSMGAATVMMASGEDLPTNVKNIIEDCGYNNVWDELTYQARQTYKMPAFPLMHTISFVNKIRQGWFFQDGSATAALAKNELPILLMHGGNDTFVPTEMLSKNYDAVKKGTPKEKVIIDGATHAQSFETNPDLYRKAVQDFLEKYQVS